MKAVIAIIFALIVVSNAGLLGSILQPVLDPVTRTLDSVTASGEAQVLLQSLQDNIKQVIDGGIGEILTNIDDDIDDLKAEWSQIFADRARLAQLVADTTHVVEVIYNAVNDPKTSPAGIRQFEAFREKITKAINARIQALASGIIQGIITLQCFRNEIPKIKQHSEEVVYQVQQVIGRVKALAQKAVEESIAAVQGLIDEFSACNGTSCQDDVLSKFQPTIESVSANVTEAKEDILNTLGSAVTLTIIDVDKRLNSIQEDIIACSAKAFEKLIR